MEEDGEKPLDLSFHALLALAKSSAKHPFFEVFLENGFLNFNIRKGTNRFRRVTEKEPAVGEPHLESRGMKMAEDYVWYFRTDEEEAAFNILGISREEACKQILKACTDEVFEKIWPEFLKALMSEDFFKYLKEKNYVKEGMQFGDFQEKIELVKSQAELLGNYLEYAIEEKRVNNGWPSQAIFEILAEINKLKLQVWKLLPNGKLALAKIVAPDNQQTKARDQNISVVEVVRIPRINIMYLENDQFGQIEFLNVCWKLHISLSHGDGNIQKAWDEVIYLALVHGIRNCKVVFQDKQHPFPAYQWGKEITLYCPHESIDWQTLLTDITIRFMRLGIEPNYIAFNDEVISGSSFFSIRNDEDIAGRYIRSLDAVNSNPSNQPKPEGLRKVSITCAQPELKKRDEKIFKFYKKLMEKVESTSVNFLQSLKDAFPRLIKVNAEFRVWHLEKDYLEELFIYFDEKTKKALILQVEEIKKVYSTVLNDLGGMSEEELLQKEEEYNKKLSAVIIIAADIINDKKVQDKKREEEADRAVEVAAWQTPDDSPKDSPRDDDLNNNNNVSK